MMPKVERILVVLILWSIPLSIPAASIAVGKPLPEVSIEASRSGELIVERGEIDYRDWHSDSLKGRTRLIYHLAARMGIDKINEDTVQQVAALGLPEIEFLILSLLNIDDSAPGVGFFARKEFEKNRMLHPHPEFVVDNASNAQRAWGLKRKGSTLIAVDKLGTVLFFKDGKVEPGETEDLLRILRNEAVTNAQ